MTAPVFNTEAMLTEIRDAMGEENEESLKAIHNYFEKEFHQQLAQQLDANLGLYTYSNLCVCDHNSVFNCVQMGY